MHSPENINPKTYSHEKLIDWTLIKLRPHLVKDRDFILINQKSWPKLQITFNGGPEIKIFIITSMKPYFPDLEPVVLNVFNSRENKKTGALVSLKMSEKQLYEHLRYLYYCIQPDEKLAYISNVPGYEGRSVDLKMNSTLPLEFLKIKENNLIYLEKVQEIVKHNNYNQQEDTKGQYWGDTLVPNQRPERMPGVNNMWNGNNNLSNREMDNRNNMLTEEEEIRIATEYSLREEAEKIKKREEGTVDIKEDDRIEDVYYFPKEGEDIVSPKIPVEDKLKWAEDCAKEKKKEGGQKSLQEIVEGITNNEGGK